MRPPYIGITDFMNVEQVNAMLEIMKAHPKSLRPRRLHVGVMMSYKTLNGLPTKWSAAFPRNEDVAAIFGNAAAMNCLHYADYDAVDVAANLARAIGFGGNGITALQLDMAWPNPDHISKALEAAGKEIELIVQVGKHAIEEAQGDAQEIARRLRAYEKIAHHVLLDKSMGKGLGMDATGLLPFLRAIRDTLPDIGLVAAGGLGPTSMDLVVPLLEEFPDISIDAQGKLRPSGNALEPIDWNMATGYLTAALRLLP